MEFALSGIAKVHKSALTSAAEYPFDRFDLKDA
jgi:hypothetical protein